MSLTPVTNFGKATVSTGYAAGAVTIVLQTGHGALLPSTFPYPLVWWNFTDYPDPADDPNHEIVSVTARVSDTLTVTRAQESTSDVNHNTASKTYKMGMCLTKAMWDNLVAKNGDTMTGALTLYGTMPASDLYAAPKVYADGRMPNPVLNPAMEIWQRGTSFAAAADGQFAADRFHWKTVGAGVVTISRSTSVPTVAEAGVLFNYSLDVDVTTADAAIAATDTYSIRHKIEGYNWRHFAQRQITVSFWVRSTKTGIHSFALRNSGADRYYIAEYTISAADTWEFKTITITASPSAGTWDYINGTGVEMIWTLAAGTDFQGTVGAWTAGALYASANQVDAMDNTANFFRLTGVKLELGAYATALQFRSFNEELQLCQRYYEKTFAYATAPATGAGIGSDGVLTTQCASPGLAVITWQYRVRKRAAPTVTTYNPISANANWRDTANTVDITFILSMVGEAASQLSGTVNAADGGLQQIHATAAAEL